MWNSQVSVSTFQNANKTKDDRLNLKQEQRTLLTIDSIQLIKSFAKE